MKPKKKFGQHFLTSQSVIAQIIEASGVQRGDFVLEIGPGQGALTKSLVEIGANVTVIEIDSDMQMVIRSKFPTVRIIDADASAVDVAELIDGERSWKCLSNLPYNVGTKIVQNLLLSSISFTGYTFMLQKEVGARMFANQGEKARGSLSNFVQAFGSVSKVCSVPPGAFFPPPNVDSIVIQIDPFDNPVFHPCSIESFERLNRALFAQPRKSIRNSLKKTFSKELVAALDDKSSVDFGLRPAQLSLLQVVDLVKVFEKMDANG